MQVNPSRSPIVARATSRPASPAGNSESQGSAALESVFTPTSLAVTGMGAALGAASAVRLAAALPPQVQTAVGVAGAVVGGAIGFATSGPASRAMSEAVSNPSLGNAAKSGALLGGTVGLLGAAAMLTGPGSAAASLPELAAVVGGAAGLGAAAGSVGYGGDVLVRHITGQSA